MIEHVGLKLKELLEARKQPELTPDEDEMLKGIDKAMKVMAQRGVGAHGQYSIVNWLHENSFVELQQHYQRVPSDHGLRLDAFSIKFPQNRRQRKYPSISSATVIVYRDTQRARHMVQIIYKHPYNPHRPREPEDEYEEPNTSDDYAGPYYWVRAFTYQPTNESEDKAKKREDQEWEKARDYIHHSSTFGWGAKVMGRYCNHCHRTWQTAWACAKRMLKELPPTESMSGL